MKNSVLTPRQEMMLTDILQRNYDICRLIATQLETAAGRACLKLVAGILLCDTSEQIDEVVRSWGLTAQTPSGDPFVMPQFEKGILAQIFGEKIYDKSTL